MYIIILVVIIFAGVVYYFGFAANKNINESNVTGSEKVLAHTLNDFKKLKLGTSYSDVEKQFGKPDKDVGSGIRIFVYTLSDGSQVWLGFAELNNLMYVKHRLNNGTTEDITVNP
jgi:hypothetical protein